MTKPKNHMQDDIREQQLEEKVSFKKETSCLIEETEVPFDTKI